MTTVSELSYYSRWLGSALGADLDALTAQVDGLDAAPPLAGQQNSRIFADYFPHLIGRELDNLSDRVDALDGGGTMPGELVSSTFARHSVALQLDWLADRVAALLLPH